VSGTDSGRHVRACELVKWEIGIVQVDALLPQTGLDFVQLIFVAVGAAGIVVVVMPWLLIAVPLMTWVSPPDHTRAGGLLGRRGREGMGARRGLQGQELPCRRLCASTLSTSVHRATLRGLRCSNTFTPPPHLSLGPSTSALFSYR
jgi:hypothetical protein